MSSPQRDEPSEPAGELSADRRQAVQAKTMAARLKALYKEDRFQAAQALARLGPAAEAACPMLVEALDDPEPTVVAAVAQALAGVGPAAVEPLTTALFDKEYHYRLPVIVALGELGVAKAVKPLCDILRSQDVEAKREAIQSLGQLGPIAREALPFLHLAEKDDLLRPAAREALSRIEGKRQLGELLQWNLTVTLAVVLALAGALAIHYYGAQVSGLGAQGLPAMIAFGWFVLGGGLGGLIGWHSYGKAAAIKGLLIFGIGGAIVGYGIGTLTANVIEPMGKVIGK